MEVDVRRRVRAEDPGFEHKSDRARLEGAPVEQGHPALLWGRHEGHPNLLPASFGDDPRAGSLGDHVRKPLVAREGANSSPVVAGETNAETESLYGAEGYVHQAAARLFRSEGGYAVVGAWVLDGRARGIGMGEKGPPITRNVSRILSHLIEPFGM